MTEDTMNLRGLLEKTADSDFLREMIGFSAQRLMEQESVTHVGMESTGVYWRAAGLCRAGRTFRTDRRQRTTHLQGLPAGGVVAAGRPSLPPPQRTPPDPIEIRYVTENTQCHETASQKVTTPSATPNDRLDIAHAAKAEQAPPLLRYRRPAGRRARPQRWRDAVTERLALQADHAAWRDALPDGLRDSATAETLQAIVELDLDVLADIEPPRGFGRE